MSSLTSSPSLSESPASAAVGTVAPEFRLFYTPDQTLALRDLRDRPVILAFYPADWNPVCRDQLALYQEFLGEFERFRASILGISVDSPWSHQAFGCDLNLTFPLLSDFEPKGRVAQTYGVYRQQEGTAGQALFIVDALGVIRWRYIAPVGVNPGVDGILTALEKLAAR